MENDYDNYGIVPKTWLAAKGSESKENSYYVRVWGWNYDRLVIERDGLICFQVTIHGQEKDCWTCKERVCFVKQQLAQQNVQCFWTQLGDSLFVTIGPPPQGTSAQKYLTFILDWPVITADRASERPSKQRQSKAASRKRHRIVQ